MVPDIQTFERPMIVVCSIEGSYDGKIFAVVRAHLFELAVTKFHMHMNNSKHTVWNAIPEEERELFYMVSHSEDFMHASFTNRQNTINIEVHSIMNSEGDIIWLDDTFPEE